MARRVLALGIATFVASVLAAGAHAAEPESPPWWSGEWSVATGFDYSSGDYERDEDTDVVYVPLSLRYRLDDLPLTAYPWDQLELRVTASYLRIRGPGDFFVDKSGTTAPRSTEEGLGDLRLRASYIWVPPVDSRLPLFELTGKLKLPTADEDRDLGTGETDWTLQLDVADSFGPFTPFATVGHRFVGEPSDGELDDSFFASLGSSLRLHRRLSVGLIYDWLEAAASTRDDSHELVAYAVYQLRPGLSLQPYAVAGLTGYVPDYALGFSLRIALKRN